MFIRDMGHCVVQMYFKGYQGPCSLDFLLNGAWSIKTIIMGNRFENYRRNEFHVVPTIFSRNAGTLFPFLFFS